jgi:hypothetical protein
VGTLNVHAPKTFTAAKSLSLFIERKEYSEPPKNIDDSDVLYVIELFFSTVKTAGANNTRVPLRS